MGESALFRDSVPVPHSLKLRSRMACRHMYFAPRPPASTKQPHLWRGSALKPPVTLGQLGQTQASIKNSPNTSGVQDQGCNKSYSYGLTAASASDGPHPHNFLRSVPCPAVLAIVASRNYPDELSRRRLKDGSRKASRAPVADMVAVH